LGKIKDGNPDILFAPTMNKEAALIAKQARDLGITATLMGGDGWGSPDVFELSGGAINGGYLVNIADASDPTIKDFIDAYKAKYNADPVMPNPVLGYDAVLWLTDALKRSGGEGGDALKAAMEATKDLQVLTGLLTMDPATHNPLNKPAVIQQAMDGLFKYVKTFVTTSD